AQQARTPPTLLTRGRRDLLASRPYCGVGTGGGRPGARPPRSAQRSARDDRGRVVGGRMHLRFLWISVALSFLQSGVARGQDPAHVLTAGDVHLRVTNRGYVGNLDPTAPNDPAGQWPGASGIEYLRSISLAVGAVDPQATDPQLARRVSYLREWGPGTAESVDRIYTSADGASGGARFVNDDGDYDPVNPSKPRIDEDFLDGRDNDGDGSIDEDFAAIGSEMASFVMRDDGPFSSNASESHTPLGLECRQLAWSYSIPGFRDFCTLEYTITNPSTHMLATS